MVVMNQNLALLARTAVITYTENALMNDDIFEDNLGYWENRFWKDYGWIPRLDTQRGIDELQEFKRECSDDGESGQSVKLVPLA